MNTTTATKAEQQLPATASRGSLVMKFASKYGVDADKMLTTLKATAFKTKQGDPEVTNEQMMALLIVADQHKLNPFTKEIFAFPDKKMGIIPVVSVDGWARIINEHPMFDGVEFVSADDIIVNAEHRDCPAWIETVIHRKDRSHPTKTKEYLDEVYRAPFKNNDGFTIKGPWQTHTKRFLRHKSLIQCARIAFGFAGIYDEDEASRIQESDDRVIATIPPGTRAEQAKEALRQTAKPAEKKPEPAVEPQSAPQTPAEPVREPPAVTAKPAESVETGAVDPKKLEADSIAKLNQAETRKHLLKLWDWVIDQHEFVGVDISQETEAHFKMLKEKLK